MVMRLQSEDKDALNELAADGLRMSLAMDRRVHRKRPRSLAAIVVRCPFGHPAVVEAVPSEAWTIAGSGPLYLVCPSLACVINAIEEQGTVGEFQAALRASDQVQRLLEYVITSYELGSTESYQLRSNLVVLETTLGAGIGGPEPPDAASCLHALASTLLAVSSGWPANTGRELAHEAFSIWLRLLPPVEECWCRRDRCGAYRAHAGRLATQRPRPRKSTRLGRLFRRPLRSVLRRCGR